MSNDLRKQLRSNRYTFARNDEFEIMTEDELATRIGVLVELDKKTVRALRGHSP